MKGTIKSKNTISWLFAHGSKFKGAGFLALYGRFGDEKSGKESNSGKVAYIAGKKMGAAPIRNRAKRRLREAARTAEVTWSGNNVALIARQSIEKVDFTEIVHDLKRLEEELAKGARDDEHDNSLHFSTLTQGDEPQNTTIVAKIVGIPSNIALSCIKVYRHAISPLFPPSCRYVPTCSEYAMIAFKRFGFWRGLRMSIKRVGRCHPLAKGGYDPVPDAYKKKLA